MVPGSAVRKAYKMVAALPFVPIGDIDMAWRFLKPTLPSDMAHFASYVENTWIGNSASGPLFDQWSWNQHEAVLDNLSRSSNIAEGWHDGFKTLVGCTNPAMWKFLECLMLEQASKDLKIAKHYNREAPAPRLPRWVEYDDNLDAVINTYDEYADVLAYLNVVAG